MKNVPVRIMITYFLLTFFLTYFKSSSCAQTSFIAPHHGSTLNFLKEKDLQLSLGFMRRESSLQDFFVDAQLGYNPLKFLNTSIFFSSNIQNDHQSSLKIHRNRILGLEVGTFYTFKFGTNDNYGRIQNGLQLSCNAGFANGTLDNYYHIFERYNGSVSYTHLTLPTTPYV